MAFQLASEVVWQELGKEIFAVLGMVTAKGEARTVGVVYAVHGHRVYIVTGRDTWKARHIRQNSHVSMTAAIPKRIPLLPWIKIPAATITFSGEAAVLDPEQVGQDILRLLLRGLETDVETLATMCVIEIQPVGDFITYGVGIPLMTMRHPEQARGRASVASG
ncbi:MAG: pyridoxamine 5'-phosphate oxidase family protein [Ardenticatenaceae bacterium]|nr:pyridoxamine 5'-phosphate oxidase family protein [Anaerolineales bacterium]MCB8923784.1 pyridoxamine 5'-phosphate oxidase family protein [Ardenticatenaceae bacterium]MCB8990119.1 pyridoxamine 5'-phosphate oxidase family protein [Ardenticatenaceae bacterium]